MMDWLQLLSARRPGEQHPVFRPGRSSFEQDYDRIIFSSPFRMLQDKTQVFPLPKHDFVHTRLTHSLEVSSVGRSLGKNVGETIISRHPRLSREGITANDFGAIVSAACLAHDLGNPPFGHSGEAAISDFFKSVSEGKSIGDLVNEKERHDLHHFEGNAQGFRILNKNQYQGLRLTFATLAAFSKYPKESLIGAPDANRKSQRKFGFFQTERDIFKELAVETGLLPLSGDDLAWTRHPLAFLVEAADDICYHIIDLEDGCNAGLVSFNETKDLLGPILGSKFKPEKLNRIGSAREKTGALRAMAIGELIEQSVAAFLDCEQDILSGKFDKALTDLIPAHDTLAKIIDLSIDKIYRSASVTETEVAGFEALEGLLKAYVPAVYRVGVKKEKKPRDLTTIRLMPEEFRIPIMKEEFDSPYPVVRLCLDFIGGLTDSHALALFRRIRGISL